LTGKNDCAISIIKIGYQEGDMSQVDVNYLAILVCGVVFMVLGALWYSPILFGKKWMTFIGKSEEEIKEQSAGDWK
jgi:Na+/glutamate symporter